MYYTPPGSVSNLTALTGLKDGEIILEWTAQGNDVRSGANFCFRQTN
jgi:hypothetical protein